MKLNIWSQNAELYPPSTLTFQNLSHFLIRFYATLLRKKKLLILLQVLDACVESGRTVDSSGVNDSDDGDEFRCLTSGQMHWVANSSSREM